MCELHLQLLWPVVSVNTGLLAMIVISTVLLTKPPGPQLVESCGQGRASGPPLRDVLALVQVVARALFGLEPGALCLLRNACSDGREVAGTKMKNPGQGQQTPGDP